MQSSGNNVRPEPTVPFGPCGSAPSWYDRGCRVSHCPNHRLCVNPLGHLVLENQLRCARTRTHYAIHAYDPGHNQIVNESQGPNRIPGSRLYFLTCTANKSMVQQSLNEYIVGTLYHNFVISKKQFTLANLFKLN